MLPQRVHGPNNQSWDPPSCFFSRVRWCFFRLSFYYSPISWLLLAVALSRLEEHHPSILSCYSPSLFFLLLSLTPSFLLFRAYSPQVATFGDITVCQVSTTLIAALSPFNVSQRTVYLTVFLTAFQLEPSRSSCRQAYRCPIFPPLLNLRIIILSPHPLLPFCISPGWDPRRSQKRPPTLQLSVVIVVTPSSSLIVVHRRGFFS